MKSKILKLTSLILVLCLLSSVFTVNLIAAADDTVTPKATPTVEIVSFMRGPQTDLRSSELLEARLTGYDGNVRELTYKWESTLGTYLYVYNSHNMYYIDGTDGEVEIYNSKVPASNNMTSYNRSYKDSFTGQGYCWAAIYGSSSSGAGTSISNEAAYTGTIKVTVYDKDGNEIASDSHTGKAETSGWLWWEETTYSGIVYYNLKDDIDNVTMGMFVGDTRNVKDLLGESAIVHISCVESSVTQGKIISGGNYIKLTQNGDYFITGTNPGKSTDTNGDAQVQITVSKGDCKFHSDTSGTATTTVYVFEKPTTSTTAYTLTLTGGLDNRCRYFIDGREGVKQEDGTILFDGLTPNTQYMVEVRGEYKDNNNTRYAYAYVYDTTKPVFNGTVEVYLDGTYDSATHTATSGTRVNLEDVSPYSTLYAKEINGTEFTELVKKPDTTGIYSNILNSGTYELYYTQDESSKIDQRYLIIHEADRTRYLFYNSVTYKDGDTELKKEYHVTNSSVNVWDEALTKDNYVFIGWKDQNGNTYKPSETLTPAIGVPYVLEALWAEATDVCVNITIDHKAEDGNLNNLDHDSKMHNVVYDLMTSPQGSNDYSDVLTKDINWDGTNNFNIDGYSVEYKDNITVYTATSPVAENVLKDSHYTVEIAKTGYELYEVTETTDDNGNIIIDAKLRFTPTNHDFKFFVELDEEAKSLPAEILPTAAHVKVTCWYDSPYIEGEDCDWSVISQHNETFITVTLDKDGKGEGTYPVWAKTADGENYHYRVQVVSYLLPDGTVLPAKDGTEIANPHTTIKHTEYCTEDKRYHSHIDVNGGHNPDNTATTLTGACFDDDTQVGTVKAIISVNTHNVTFEPDGGKFADGTTENKVATKQILVPNLNDYAVTKDGGYVFDGWYLVENSQMTDKTVSSGDNLYNDITLRAKWKAPLTVEGIISVAGYYHLDGNKNNIRVIASGDRTHAITVYLQKILPNGYSETIETQKIDIVYNDMGLDEVDEPMGTGFYRFTAIPDDGSEYRIFIQNPNYDVKYQHEPNSINPTTMFDFENYYFHETESNEKQFIAKFGETDPLVADVNAFLEFKPHDFALHYSVNTSAITKNFRPSTTDVLVLYNDFNHGNHPQDWAVITQMYDGEVKQGQKTDIDASTAIGNNSYDVWRTMPDGHTLYDYSVLLQNYTMNNEKTEFDAEKAPFFAFYNGSARYSAIEGLTPPHQTQLLTIELQPKRYTVTFDIDFTETHEDYVENMQSYIVYTDNNHTYQTGHIWSYDTDISNVIPTRKGYKFLGWYDSNDNLVTNIDASVHENVTVKAKWEKIFKVTFHANNADINYDVFRTYYENGFVESGENNFSLNADGSIDAFYDIPEFEYYTHNKYVFKGWYIYDENNVLQPINWKEKYTEDTDVYAQWISVEDVEKDETDTKLYDKSGMYPGYDLLGVQIRDVEKDDIDHYGDATTGIRFVTVLSEDVYSQINSLNSANANGAEYGYALAKTATAQKYAGNTEGYKLEYKGTNVNGRNTTADYKYVSNVKCSGVPDHFGGEGFDYRLYTAVVTFKNLEGDALAQAHSQSLIARSYIRYTDANGLLRTHYNNYTGTNTFSSCSASFDLAKSLMNG